MITDKLPTFLYAAFAAIGHLKFGLFSLFSEIWLCLKPEILLAAQHWWICIWQQQGMLLVNIDIYPLTSVELLSSPIFVIVTQFCKLPCVLIGRWLCLISWEINKNTFTEFHRYYFQPIHKNENPENPQKNHTYAVLHWRRWCLGMFSLRRHAWITHCTSSSWLGRSWRMSWVLGVLDGIVTSSELNFFKKSCYFNCPLSPTSTVFQRFSN